MAERKDIDVTKKTDRVRLSEKAMLVAFNASAWTARKIDKVVTKEVNIQHGAKSGAGRYNKCLIDPTALAKVQNIVNSARDVHRNLSLPWLTSGTRIMPTTTFDKFREKMATLRTAFDTEVEKFIAEYPDAIENARDVLGDMFNDAEYPSAADLRKRFDWNVSILPLPEDTSDFRVKLNEAAMEELRASIARDTETVMQGAVRDCFDRLTEVVVKMSERLGAYTPGTGENRATGTFRDSLVENVRELVEILPALNIAGDAVLAKAIEDARTKLCKHDAQQLRDDPEIRKSVKEAADDIIDAMSAFMGAPDA